MSEEVTFYQNPDFDEVFIFYDEEVFTSKEIFKPVEGGMYERTNKANAVGFIARIKEILEQGRKDKWPYKQKLMICIGVSGTKSLYGTRDIDNMVKPILDALKGIVFVDDKQVHLLIASKHIWDKNLKGFMVGLRVLEDGRIDKYEPWLYTTNPTKEFMDKWEKKFRKKVE